MATQHHYTPNTLPRAGPIDAVASTRDLRPSSDRMERPLPFVVRCVRVCVGDVVCCQQGAPRCWVDCRGTVCTGELARCGRGDQCWRFRHPGFMVRHTTELSAYVWSVQGRYDLCLRSLQHRYNMESESVATCIFWIRCRETMKSWWICLCVTFNEECRAPGGVRVGQ